MARPSQSPPPFPPNTPPPWTAPHRPPGRELDKLIRTDTKPPSWYTDMYAFLLRIGWGRLLFLYVLLYAAINAVFANLYMLLGPCIKGADPHSWLDAFFFSVQTLSTIGYGGMTPQGLAGNVLVTIESMLGVIGIALATGLVFAKFARPTARVMFSRAAVINTFDGTPALMFRLANKRGTNIVEASLRVTVLLNETTSEGHTMRRLHDLKIRRNFTPVFILSWLVVHKIDEDSPLYGLTMEEMREQDIRVIITLTGIDGVFSQTIHAYHFYWANEIYEGLNFVDVIEPRDNGIIHFRVERFHDLEPATIAHPLALSSGPTSPPPEEDPNANDALIDPTCDPSEYIDDEDDT